mgnify:CR=1 FL=1
MTKKKISSSLEDYLEAISEIIAVNGHAHTKDIAKRLQVKMPSVTNALQALSVRGLIRYQSHAPVVLTALGAETAAVIVRRHRALKRFFTEILKIDQDEAEDVACEIEHVIGEKVMSRFVTLSEAINERDDCRQLREYLDVTMPQICVDSKISREDLTPLNELPIGETAMVIKVGENLRGIKKFADLGLVNGTVVTMEGRAPLGDLLRVRVMGSSLSMRASDAAYIRVKITE